MGDYQPRHASSATNLHCTTSKSHHPRPVSIPVADALAFTRRLLSEAYERLQDQGVDPDALESSFAPAFASTGEGAAAVTAALRQPGRDDREPRDPAPPEPAAGADGIPDTGPSVQPPVPDRPGANLRPDPGEAGTVAEFLECLRNYRTWAGSPSYRVMSRNCKRRFAPSTLCTALGGETLPGLEMVLAIVSACGGTAQHRSEFATAWRRLAIPQQDTGKAAS